MPGIEQSERERQFVARFEQEEKYNLAVLSNAAPKNDTYVFFRPVRGIVQQHFDALGQAYGVSILTSPGESVLSVLDGTVVYADYSFDHGWVVHVQHEGNYLSIYQNNTRLLKKGGRHRTRRRGHRPDRRGRLGRETVLLRTVEQRPRHRPGGRDRVLKQLFNANPCLPVYS